MEYDIDSIANMVKAFAPPTCLEDGVKTVHKHIVHQGLENDMMVASALVEMYAKYKCIDDAKSVFNSMTVRDVVSWTSMMSGYSECECREDVLMLFHQMLHEGVHSYKTSSLGMHCCLDMNYTVGIEVVEGKNKKKQ